MEPVRLEYRSRPAEPYLSNSDPKLDLKVIFTDLRNTAAALTAARNMARGLRARITLVAAQVVPYPLPLADPPVPAEFMERMLKSIAVEDMAVEIYLCRDRFETIRRALAPDSLVILGTGKRWWPSWFSSWERSLAKRLRREGLRVLTV